MDFFVLLRFAKTYKMVCVENYTVAPLPVESVDNRANTESGYIYHHAHCRYFTLLQVQKQIWKAITKVIITVMINLLYFISIIFISCDRKYEYNYYIINKCNEDINVVLIDFEDKYSSYRINPQKEQLIYHGEGYSFLELRTVKFFLKEIKITKGDKTSKVNYVDNDLWGQKSKKQENIYLTVKEDDFE